MLGSKPKRYALPAILVVGALVIYVVATGKPAPNNVPDLSEPVANVHVDLIERGTEALWIESQGVVEPALKTVLTAQVSGRVDSVDDRFANGGEFVKGDALIQIERADYEIAVSEAQAGLIEAERALAVEKGAVRQAKREWRDLGSDDANALFLRKPQLAAATANVEASKARLRKAQLNLQRSTISAPYDGLVSNKAVDVGQFIAVGSMLGEIYARERFELRLPLAAEERYLLGDAVGRAVDIYTDQYGKRLQWQGEIIRVESAIDSKSRQFYVVASMSAPYSAAANKNSEGIPLSVGQFVQARIAAIPQADVFRIPRSALRQPNKIWIVEEGDRLNIYDVDIVYRDSIEAIVRSADISVDGPVQLVVSDLSVVKSGQQVNVVSAHNNALDSAEAAVAPIPDPNT